MLVQINKIRFQEWFDSLKFGITRQNWYGWEYEITNYRVNLFGYMFRRVNFSKAVSDNMRSVVVEFLPEDKSGNIDVSLIKKKILSYTYDNEIEKE